MIDEDELDDLFGEQEDDHGLLVKSLSKKVKEEKSARDVQDSNNEIETSAKQEDILMLLKAPEIYRLDQEVCGLREAQDALKEAFEECADDRKAAELHQRALLTTRAIIGEDGKTVHTNTRLIQWSDGSFTLYLNGGQAHLEILRQDPLGREYLFHPTPQDGGSMIGAGRFEERLIVKPPPPPAAGMLGRLGEEEDEVKALASQGRRQEAFSQKVKLMAVATTVDPELEKSRMAKLELERARLRRKQEEARRKLLERERSSSRIDSRPSSTLELSRFLEEESDPDDGEYQSDFSDVNEQEEQSQSNDSDSDSNQLGKKIGSKRKSRSIRIVDE